MPFIFRNGIVKTAQAEHLVCSSGTVDFSTSPPTTIITHSPGDVKTEEGWAEAIAINPLVREGKRKVAVNFNRAYKWTEAFDIRVEAEKYGWAEAVKIPRNFYGS